jgi:Acyltransferase
MRIYVVVGWCYGAITGNNPSVRVLLTDSLRTVPVFGWAMQLMIFIFISRDRVQDLRHISKTLLYLIQSNSQPSIFIFPEGTDLSKANIDRSNKFAVANNLPETQYTLQPKVGGLLECISNLRGRGLALHDITIAYTDFRSGSRLSLNSLLRGESMRYAPFIQRWTIIFTGDGSITISSINYLALTL